VDPDAFLERFGAVDTAPRPVDERAAEFRPTPFKHRDLSAFPRQQFIYGRHYIRQFLSATAAGSGVGKSSLSIAEIVAMTSGRSLLGLQPIEPLRVWYWNGEDPAEEIQRRIEATCLHFGIDPSEIEGRLMVFGLDALDDRLPEVAVGQPLSLEDAAAALGLRRRNARQIFETPAFRKMLTAKIADLRVGAHPRMIRNMIDIANDPGEGTAADRTVRLKASLAVLGEQAKDGGVTVNVGVQTNVATDIRPGYVLDLSAMYGRRADPPAMIEYETSEDGELE
jgi:hypothetical protein